MKILSIDPSVSRKAGWATYDTETEDYQWGCWQIDGMNYKCRCHDLKDNIIRTIGSFDQIVCEWPCYYGSTKGQIAAQQGYTINLAGIVMFIVGWFQVEPKNLFLYTAPQWKGSVPKEVTARKFFRSFGLAPFKTNQDAIDAVMMLKHHNDQTK